MIVKKLERNKEHKQELFKIKDMPESYRDMLLETIIENERRGDFMRIYPHEGTEYYDKFYKSVKPVN